MKQIIKSLVLTIILLIGSVVTVQAATSTGTLQTVAWGKFGPNGLKTLKTDNNNGYFKLIDKSAWFFNYAQATENGYQASHSSKYLLDPDESNNFATTIWFSYTNGNGALYNGRYISAKVATSNLDPNGGWVELTLAP